MVPDMHLPRGWWKRTLNFSGFEASPGGVALQSASKKAVGLQHQSGGSISTPDYSRVGPIWKTNRRIQWPTSRRHPPFTASFDQPSRASATC